jgi:integrase
LAASGLGLDPWEPDRWDVRGLPIGEEYRHQRVSWIDWRALEPAWLRALAKRWARHRLSTGSRSPATIHSAAKQLRHFSRFLEREGIELSGPVALTRPLLERYRACVLELEVSVSYKRLLLGTLNTLLGEARRLEWAPIPASACYLPGELPRLRDSLPRAIDGPVMAQLESNQALSRIDSATVRTAVIIVIETGLRAVDVCRLAFHPLLSGADGAPYLRYFNHKLKREAVIPVSDRLLAAVARQQEYVERTWPAGSDWLLPRPRSNPNGEHPLGYSMLHKTIGRWLAALELRDTAGRDVTVTAHQFRHTLATRMINDGVPLEAIRRYLDHNSETMTLRYARLHDTELRRHWERWQRQRVNIHGEVLPAEHEQLRDAAWTKETLARARQALPNGYCGLPLQQTCPHPNACLGCDSFLSDASHLNNHRAHLDRVERMIAQADERGWDRVADNNRRDRNSLINIIQALERADDDGQQSESGAGHG